MRCSHTAGAVAGFPAHLLSKGGNEPVRRTPVGLRLRGASSPFVEPAPVSADTKDGDPAARSCS